MEKKYWAILVLLAVSNVFLYWQVKQSHRALKDVEINLVTARSSIQYALHTSIQEGTFRPAAKAHPFSVIVILDERGCGPCIRSDIRTLNTYWDSIKEYTVVYYYGASQAYLQGHEIKFDATLVAHIEDIFGEDFGPVNPVSFLMANGEILDLRIANPTNPHYESLASAWYSGVSAILTNSGTVESL